MTARRRASAGAGYLPTAPRALIFDDAVPARALIHAALGATPYVDRAIELLEAAACGGDPEARALVIERDGTIAGIVLFGAIAGTDGAARLHALVIDRGVNADDVGERLTTAAVTAAAAAGGRLLVAELPDDPALGTTATILRRHGFHEAARIPDFFRDGIALVLLRRDLG